MLAPKAPNLYGATLGNVAANVRRLRLALGLSQWAAARAAGLNERYWQKVEAAESNIGLASLCAIATVLEACPTTLLLPPPDDVEVPVRGRGPGPLADARRRRDEPPKRARPSEA